MPGYDADGKETDKPTTWQPDPDGPDGAGRCTADIAGVTDFRAGDKTTTWPRDNVKAGRHALPTKPVRKRDAGPPTDDGRTRVYRPNRSDPRPDDASPVDPVDPMDDPPVGWLVIVAGPGKGGVVTLGMGVNSMGRDRDQRVSLDFGDEMISRVNHGTITYDPRGRKFYVQHGGGTNLTYVDDEPVLAPRVLEPLMHLQIGNTVLRFVPLCGEEFSWDDKSEAGDG